MTAKGKLTISNFTDPMMGLSYESEPFFRRLETRFQGRVELRFVMSGLVRDVFDFVDPSDLQHGKAIALERYNARLAGIYEAEEPISGMPISMTGFNLFSTKHTSSLPLNLAYKAVQLADPDKADLFLYNLRFATIVDCRPTTRFEEILAVVEKTKIDRDAFYRHFTDGSAQAALDKDLAFRQRSGVRTLPAYLFEYAGRQVMVSGVIDSAGFASVIDKLTGGELSEVLPPASIETVRALIDRHPLISPIEIREALGLRDLAEVRDLIQPLLDAGEIHIKDVARGWFIERCNGV